MRHWYMQRAGIPPPSVDNVRNPAHTSGNMNASRHSTYYAWLTHEQFMAQTYLRAGHLKSSVRTREHTPAQSPEPWCVTMSAFPGYKYSVIWYARTKVDINVVYLNTYYAYVRPEPRADAMLSLPASQPASPPACLPTCLQSVVCKYITKQTQSACIRSVEYVYKIKV